MLNAGSCETYTFCDFEPMDYCGYKIDNSQQTVMKWYRWLGSGHDHDHTYEFSVGSFMIAKTVKPNIKGRMTRLLTHEYTETVACAQFWYKIIGDIEFNVRIYTLDVYQSQTYFSARFQRGNQWALGQASINNSQPYQVWSSINVSFNNNTVF